MPGGSPTTITPLSTSEFEPAPTHAEKATADGPVMITDNGQTSYVLLSAEAFHRLAARGMSLAEMPTDDAVAKIEFDLPLREIWPERDLNLD